MAKWQDYSDKFLSVTSREQYLILLTGLIAIVFILFNFFVEKNIAQTKHYHQQILQLSSENQTKKSSIEIFEQALESDPDASTKEQLAAYEDKLAQVDTALLALTSELIDPVQMRYALLELLKTQKGVSLLSFQLVGAHAINIASVDNQVESDTSGGEHIQVTEQPNLSLYRHGIKIKLRGSYFQLRDYLAQLEAMSWKFFWQNFDYKLQQYPLGELDIEIYSLSTKQEFVGV